MIDRLISKSKRTFRKIKKSIRKSFKKKDSGDANNLTGQYSRQTGDINILFNDFLKRGLKINYILDIGAHSAGWIRNAVQYYPEATAYLIEPLSEMEKSLKQFCVDHPGSKYFLNGAGAREETLYLTAESSLEGATFVPEINPYLISSKIQREIKVITVDSLIKAGLISIPEIVKIDVQGYELEVLKGAELLFGKTEAFILEISLFEFVKGTPVFSEVISFMAQRGYEVYDFAGFLRRPFDGALGQIDVCFAMKDGYLRARNDWHKIQ